MALNVLQNAIKEKTAPYEMPVGESEIFKQAGVTGMGALSSSLKARGDELQLYGEQFRDVVESAFGSYSDIAKIKYNEYQKTLEEYNNEANRLQKIEDSLREHQQQMELQKNLYELRAKERQLEAALSSSSSSGAGYGSMGQTSDATADQIFETIKQTGGYSIQPKNWKEWSSEYANEVGKQALPRSGKSYTMDDIRKNLEIQSARAGESNLEMTSTNQDDVAKWKIQKWLEQGYSPDDIASMWSGDKTGNYAKRFNKILSGKTSEATTGGDPVNFYGQDLSGDDVSALVENLRGLVADSPSKSKAFEQSYKNAAKRGNEAIKDFAFAQYKDKMLGVTEKREFENIESGIRNYKEALDYINANPDLKSGFYKATQEGLKPYGTFAKDPRYTTLLNYINLAESPIRLKNYGTNLAGNEERLAKNSLLDTNDDIANVKLKIEQGINAYETGLNKKVTQDLGIGYLSKGKTNNSEKNLEFAGKTKEEAIQFLEDNGQKVTDNNINYLLNL
jgi:hypothetical protein